MPRGRCYRVLGTREKRLPWWTCSWPVVGTGQSRGPFLRPLADLLPPVPVRPSIPVSVLLAPRVECTSSSSLTLTLPAGCAFSLWPSSSASASAGCMVSRGPHCPGLRRCPGHRCLGQSRAQVLYGLSLCVDLVLLPLRDSLALPTCRKTSLPLYLIAQGGVSGLGTVTFGQSFCP